MDKVILLLDLKPADTPDYMIDAWLSCLGWAIKQPEILAAFRADTGMTWEPARTALDRMVDEATGAPRQFILAFIKWANINVWGPLDGPEED